MGIRRQAALLTVILAAPLCGTAQEKFPNLISPYTLEQPQTSGFEHRAPEVPSGNGFDWIVSIGHKGKSHALGGHFCGGSVIGTRWVLTAAHCLHDKSGKLVTKNDIQIRTGYELHKGGKIYPLELIIAHPKYAVTAYNSTVHDIALVKTTEDIVIYGDVQMLRPVAASQIQDSVVVLGWGKPGKHLNYLSERLRYLQLTRIENQRCNDAYYSGLIDDKMICAIGEGTDACQGDSGGPLLALFEDTTFSLYGVVSWGDQCGASQKPGIYASVPAYLDWIESTMKNN